MHKRSCLLLALTVLLHAWEGVWAEARFTGGFQMKDGVDVPISSEPGSRLVRRGPTASGESPLGNNVDMLYTIPLVLGNEVYAVHLDTGSSDLWVISDQCRTNACAEATSRRYPSSSFNSTQRAIELSYGDSTGSSSARGTIGREKASVAGLAMAGQPFALVDDTTNPVVRYGVSGLFGMGFPSSRYAAHPYVPVNGEMTPSKQNPEDLGANLSATDNFIRSTPSGGPLLARMMASNSMSTPVFTISLHRNTIDVGGRGQLTIGKYPDGVDESSFTWVPLRYYRPEEGGLPPPSFAPNTTYPLRWEIDIESVFLDGQRLSNSNIPGKAGDPGRTSALLDTGNSAILGPRDVVQNVMQTVGTTDRQGGDPLVANFACNVPHTLSFQIAGKMFPIDPRDFIGEVESNNTQLCKADNLLATDPPSIGMLFSWSLGTPFFRSNLVAFRYGNLTHPASDPPRIGIMSLVPPNADALLVDAVSSARRRGGFPNSVQDAPTALSIVRPTTTLTQQLPTQASSLNATNSARTLSNSCFVLAIFNFMILVYLSG